MGYIKFFLGDFDILPSHIAGLEPGGKIPT